MPQTKTYDQILSRINESNGISRTIVGIAGSPAAGKSELAARLAADINSQDPGSSIVVGMDGFHFDDVVLDRRGLRSVKGHPSTFDAAGFCHLVARLAACEPETAAPTFDRSLELSRAGSTIVKKSVRVVVVEGNYLLLRETPWEGLRDHFNLTVFVTASNETLRSRLVERGRSYGWEDAANKIEQSDLANAALVIDGSHEADMTYRTD